MTNYVGTSGDDTIEGSGQGDVFDLTDGGDDAANGRKGADIFVLDAAFTADDSLAGGDGSDLLALDGDYGAEVVFRATTITGVETIAVGPGDDYRLVLHDANIALDATLFINALNLRARDSVRIDATGETDGLVWMYAGRGNDRLDGGAHRVVFFDTDSAVRRGSDTVKGGAGDDYIQLNNGFDSSDKIDGGAGNLDHVLVTTGYAAGLTIDGGMLKGVELLQVNGTGEAAMSLTMEDSVLKAGQHLSVVGALLGTTTLNFDGLDETNGSYGINTASGADTLRGGSGNDTFETSDGDDVLVGGGGGDTLTGGVGSDRFVYRATADSTPANADYIQDLATGDLIDLSAIDAKASKVGDQAFNLVAAFTGKEAQAVLSYDGATTSLSLDTNGDAVADAVITMAGDQTGFTGFVL